MVRIASMRSSHVCKEFLYPGTHLRPQDQPRQCHLVSPLRVFSGKGMLQPLSVNEIKVGTRALRWYHRGCGLPLSRSEEHTSELQSLAYLVCRLLLEKKKTTT